MGVGSVGFGLGYRVPFSAKIWLLRCDGLISGGWLPPESRVRRLLVAAQCSAERFGFFAGGITHIFGPIAAAFDGVLKLFFGVLDPVASVIRPVLDGVASVVNAPAKLLAHLLAGFGGEQ